MLWCVEQGGRQQLAVGGDDLEVGRELGDRRQRFGIAQARRLQDGDARLRCNLRDGRAAQLAPAPRAAIGLRDDRDRPPRAVDQRPQGGYREIGRTEEDQIQSRTAAIESPTKTSISAIVPRKRVRSMPRRVR